MATTRLCIRNVVASSDNHQIMEGGIFSGLTKTEIKGLEFIVLGSLNRQFQREFLTNYRFIGSSANLLEPWKQLD